MKTKKQEFRITSISPRDAFYPDKEIFIGRTCSEYKATIITGSASYSRSRLPAGFKKGWVFGINLVVKGMEDFLSGYVAFSKVKLLKV